MNIESNVINWGKIKNNYSLKFFIIKYILVCRANVVNNYDKNYIPFKTVTILVIYINV